MAQFRTTADIVDAALKKAGETTNGNSPYESDALDYINHVHYVLLAGGTIPVGKDTSIEIDEAWPWSRSKKDLIIELQPKYETGTISLTKGSEVGAFSAAVTDSLEGWHLQVDGRPEWFRINQHTAGATAFELDSLYPDATGGTLNYKAVKLDYDLIPTHITVDSSNNKIQFEETASTTLTGTITSGVYALADYATAVKTAMDAAGASTYTVTYSEITKKFTIASDRGGGGGVFILKGTGDQSKFSAHKDLGFDDADTADAASVESTYVFGGIARLIEPFEVFKGSNEEGNIYGLDPESFKRNEPLAQMSEGIPDRFTVISEDMDGLVKVRFNRYPREKTRVKVYKVDVPRDLKDSASSIPLVPRKHISLLEDAATFRIMMDKSDSRAQLYASLLQGKLEAMISQHRGSLQRTGKFFGQIVSRPENVRRVRRRNLFDFGYD